MSRWGFAVVVTVEVSGSDVAAGVGSLRAWLVGDEEWRGRVRVLSRPPEPGALGSMIEALTVAVGQGGAVTALASVVIAWIRRRRGDEVVKITRPDGGSIEVRATHVRGLDAAGVSALVSDLAKSLDAEGESDGDKRSTRDG